MYLVDPVISNDERIIRLLKPARAREEGREVIKSADRVNRTLEVVFESTLHVAFNDLHPRDPWTGTRERTWKPWVSHSLGPVQVPQSQG